MCRSREGERRGEREGEGEAMAEREKGWHGTPHDAESLKNYRLPVQDGNMRVPVYSSCLARSHGNSRNLIFF